MERFVDRIINILEKNTAIKNVFVISKERYNEKFRHEVDRLERNKMAYISDIDNYFEYFEKHFPNDHKESSEYIDFHQLIVNKPICWFDDASLYELAYCKLLTLLYVVQGYIETDLPLSDGFKKSTTYYRGQSDYSYKLLPSLYRGLRKDGVIDFAKLSKMYQDTFFFEKYCNHIEKISHVNYSFISFIQHAVAYSPLLDFSEDKDIALVFASASDGKNYNAYQQTDAGLYSFYSHGSITSNKDIDSIIKEQQVQYYSGKLKYSSTIFGKPLLECDIDDFSVDLYSFSAPTNDRMKYQKGVFLYFQKCVIVNGELFFPYSFGYIAKSKIPCKETVNKSKLSIASKEDIYNTIVNNNPSLDMNHLLNPYLTFGEYTR